MEETWYTGVANELARCLLDAESCAETCEALLESMRSSEDAELQQLVVVAVVGPAAVARVLIDLIDQPSRLVLAACRMSREMTASALDALGELDGRAEVVHAVAALRASAASCERLLEAAG